MNESKQIAGRNRVNPRDRGLASFIAVVMISIVAMGALALTALFQTDAKRTQHHGAETQLRELLLAGGAAAISRVMDEPNVSGVTDIDLPQPIEDAALTTEYVSGADRVKRVIVTARIGTYRAGQTLTFTRDGGGWSLQKISLDRLR